MLKPQSQPPHPHHAAALLAELNTHQLKGLAPSAAFVGVGFIFELLQGLALRGLSGRSVRGPIR